MKTVGTLQLADGQAYPGELVGSSSVQGEVVFFTGMTGYQEVLTDPSYRGQIIVFTYPLIGQYGISAMDSESQQIQVAGVVVQTLANNGTRSDLADWLAASGIPVLGQVDTRALVHHLRTHGDQVGLIEMNEQPSPQPSDLIAAVSTRTLQVYDVDQADGHVVCIDYGVKKSMIAALNARQMKVTVVPFDTPKSVIDELKPDGLLFSNGPGDPVQLDHLTADIKQLAVAYPTLGICMGHQIIAKAFGCQIEKQHHGHRGANHPVRELTTGRVFMTSQNHGYVVQATSVEASELVPAYRHINDGSIEGLVHPAYPILTVQFHPEAHPGPVEAMVIFDQFVASILKQEVEYAG
ncbi:MULTISPECIES: carbamoyl phosphate synthase small subunit [Exiguobacterium]|uniref:carbamoyl phosphate synthase small subunit n=1 Tax=Exiguobacterium TaxID=33986 RepID=UPI0004787E4E|nr:MULTISPECIES: carbamoyl phosphate synthase small subunit [Exiguobacterium]MCT4779371.1 carbamoyl phosphate synthase small subunit [Exiguobacterium soli]